ncbi:MAG: 30S ribosomal protein S3 [Candidatus Bathyarchaeia archaeon]
MSTLDHFVSESIKKAEIDEYLSKRLQNAGYAGVEIAKTPLGVRLSILSTKPGLVIGRGGEVIKELSKEIQERFNLPSPQISVADVPLPELNPYIIASQIASALQRGIHFRRAAFWALERIMKAGALGAEITIRGKLRTNRARHEKFVEGYLPKVGDPAMKYLRTAVLSVQLKPGLWGIKVRILPPEAVFPDKIVFKAQAQAQEKQEATREVPISSGPGKAQESQEVEGEEEKA